VIDQRPPRAPRPDAKGGIIFSLRDGEVWASWHGWPETVRLGPVADVTAMMQDFLHQGRVAERLLASDEGANP